MPKNEANAETMQNIEAHRCWIPTMNWLSPIFSKIYQTFFSLKLLITKLLYVEISEWKYNKSFEDATLSKYL